MRSAVELSPAGIAAYARACGFRREQGVPLSYPHVLAFPLHLMLLTRPSFPYPASGMVHLANRIRQHQRLHEGQALRLEVYCERWVAHPKGQALSIATRAYSQETLVWESDSLYLRRDVSNPVGEPWSDPLPLQEDGLLRTQRWVLPADLGRRFAKVSGISIPFTRRSSVPGCSAFVAPSPMACGPWAAHWQRNSRQVAWTRPRPIATSNCRSSCPARLPCGATRERPTARVRSAQFRRGQAPYARAIHLQREPAMSDYSFTPAPTRRVAIIGGNRIPLRAQHGVCPRQ